MKFLLVPNTTKAHTIEITKKAATILAKTQNTQIFLDETLENLFKDCDCVSFCPFADALAQCDMVISVGGDGSMLHTARHMAPAHKPLIGINTGRLGFLTALEDNELDKLLLLTKGEYTVEHRSMLRYECRSSGEQGVALNDIVLFKETAEKAIALELYCDEILVSKFRGDGVVFSTPTGSTAYSMSAGGPIVDARLSAMIVTQICAHIVHMPPMVFAKDRMVRAASTGSATEAVSIITDGTIVGSFMPGDSLHIRQADTKVPLVQFYDTDQLKSIDKKLKGR